MTRDGIDLGATWWRKNRDEIDHEIARRDDLQRQDPRSTNPLDECMKQKWAVRLLHGPHLTWVNIVPGPYG